MLAELEVRERRFDAGHGADVDTLFHPLRGKDGASFRMTAGEEVCIVLGTLETCHQGASWIEELHQNLCMFVSSYLQSRLS